ncbi:hypothetical protein [Candidatus Tisiphia endosymbiont of Nemotelus uliginosus]|uniref:hypothetical protein n=1 Tax=Candidatus Tisiphia endosymbiont of Nemotelus uliginosus TaxID=3077926 RepID=UPI0035C9343C
MLKTQGPEPIRELIVPEIEKLATGHQNNQIKSIELEFSKGATVNNVQTLQTFQNAIKSLERFVSPENITTALPIYKDHGLKTFITYSNKICSTTIEHKIIADLQTMQNKFNPNYHLVDARFRDIVIYDFKGKSHVVPEDYLIAIGKDKQVMRYIKPESKIAKEIKYQLKDIAETQQKRVSVRLV